MLALLPLVASRVRSDPRKMSGAADLGAGSIDRRASIGAGPAVVMGATLDWLAERSGLRPEPPPPFGWVTGLPPIVRGGGAGVTLGNADGVVTTGLALP